MERKSIFDLSGRAAIVTGGASGIGRTICQTLAEYGADVAAVDLNEQKLKETIDLLSPFGHQALAIKADISRPAEVAYMVNQALTRLGAIDILFNCAGITLPPARVGEIPVEDWDRVMAVDLRGVFLCMRAALSVMAKQKRGCIINISSTASLRASDPQVAPSSYSAAKAGVNSLTQCAAVEYAKDGVRVNAIAPGVHDTGFGGDNAQWQEQRSQVMAEVISKHIPLGRPGKVEELKGLIIFLASDASSYVTGQVFVQDGGRTARM
jgi:NAD(P)-dependent dehydrogenase (short-subunit alcohol dehydrogenase family)